MKKIVIAMLLVTIAQSNKSMAARQLNMKRKHEPANEGAADKKRRIDDIQSAKDYDEEATAELESLYQEHGEGTGWWKHRAKIIRLITQKNANPNVPRGSFTMLPLLTRASVCGDKGVTACALSQGADPNIRDRKGKTPLFYALKPRQLQQLLEGGADPLCKAYDGTTLLHNAIQHPAYFKFFKKYHALGVEVNDCSCKGVTPLHMILEWGFYSSRIKQAKIILDEGGCLHQPDNNGITPLSIMEKQITSAPSKKFLRDDILNYAQELKNNRKEIIAQILLPDIASIISEFVG